MESLKGKLTEEEANQLYDDLYVCGMSGRQYFLKRLKIKGYIKQNPVEKAKKEYYDSFENYFGGHPKKATKYIKELEKQLGEYEKNT